jgi:uroporphyrinogen-III synthase
MAAKILITRSEPGASATATRVADAGFVPVPTPMLRIAPAPIPRTVEGVQGLLVTSVNAARRLAELASPPPRVLTVGGATAEAARAAGAGDVLSADGDVHALTALARRALDPKAGALLHWRGREVAGDLAGALRAAGFEVREQVVYAAEPEERLSPEAEQALADGSARAVLFHSARGAGAFLEAAGRAGPTEPLSGRLSGLIAVALSEQAGAPAAGQGFARVVAAAQPLESSLIEALTSALNDAA